LRDRIVAELKARKAYLCNAAQKDALSKLLVTPNFTINPACVGQPPTKIAQMGGFQVPADTSILVVEMEGVGKQHPLSMEKLSPVLALYFVPDFAAAMEVCTSLLRFGGLGHTCVIYSNDDTRIRDFALRMPAMRVLVNTPAPQGSTGITTNVFPSMTLGCGAMAGNITGDNIGPQHLINVKRLAYAVRRADEAFQIPPAQASAAQHIDRQTVAAAVERYLTTCGVSVSKSTVPNVAAEVVDRFLASRSVQDRRPEAPAPRPEPPSKPNPTPNPAPEIVDFVCEDDVRVAIRESHKIFVGPRTIVTPSARELAARFDILVLAQR